MSPLAITEVRRSVVASGEPRHRAFPGVVKLSSGDILVFYRDGSDHWRTSDGVVKMVRSKDEGQSWSAPELVFSESGWGAGAHHGPEQLSDGRLILPMTLITNVPRDVGTRGYRDADVSRASKVYILTSEDGGESWSEPAQVGPLEGWSWENQYGRVRELPDGRVFVPGGGQKSGDDAWYSGYFVSHDGGRTFPDRVEVARGIRDEIDLARLPDGRWIAMVRDVPPYHMYQAYSEDEGRTWSEPVRSGLLGNCPSFLVLPSGTLLLGHRQVDRARTHGCAISASTDGGASWEHVSDIYIAPGDIRDCSYPSMVLLEDGRVFCVYYTEFVDGNCDIEGLTFEVTE